MGVASETHRFPYGREFRVGAWLVTPALDELRRGAERVRLEPKVMEVLVFLASRQGEPVSRDELLSAVWQGVLVGDDALTQAVTKLRKALGDDPRSPSYIETISKRGYRFVATVKALSGPAAKRELHGTSIRVGWRTGAAGALLISMIALTYLVLASSEKRATIGAVESYLPKKLGAEARLTPPTIIVTPFDSMTDKSEHAYLARSISMNLATDLSRLAGVRVIGATRVADETPSPVALVQSGARYVVSGSLQRSGDQLKVIVQLADSQTGLLLWSERYDRPFQNLFAIQQEMIAQLVAALRIEVTRAEHERLARGHTRNLDAYDHFLRAQSALLTRQRADNERARELYREAVRLDPTFARAYAGIALTYAAEYRNQWTEKAPQALARAAELAETAFAIDPDILEVHWVLAYVHVHGRRHEQAMVHLRQVIQIDPAFSDAYSLLGGIHTYIGQPEKAVAMLRTAARLNPDRGYLWFLHIGRAYFFLGDGEQASINLREALSRNPASLEARVYLAATLSVIGNHESARWEAEEIRALAPDFSASKWLETYPMTDSGQKRRLVRSLAELGL